LAYADGVNLLGDSIDTINKNTQTLIDVSKKVGLEVNAEKIKYMLVFHYRNAYQNREECQCLLLGYIASNIRLKRISELGKVLAVTSSYCC
jgi:hypothetical protein